MKMKEKTMTGLRIQTYPMRYTLPNGNSATYYRDGNLLQIFVFIRDAQYLSLEDLIPVGIDPKDCTLKATAFDGTGTYAGKHITYEVRTWAVKTNPQDPKDPKAWKLPEGYVIRSPGWKKEKESEPAKKRCTCSMDELMLHGCKCGGK